MGSPWVLMSSAKVWSGSHWTARVTLDRGLQLLGMSGLGMGGGFERLHYLLESAFDADGHLSITFLRVRRALAGRTEVT